MLDVGRLLLSWNFHMSKYRSLAAVYFAVGILLVWSQPGLSEGRNDRRDTLQARVCALVPRSDTYYLHFERAVDHHFYPRADASCLPVLWISWFPANPPRTTCRFVIEASGDNGTTCIVYDWASQGTLGDRYGASDLEALRRQLAYVQPSYLTPSLTCVLLVSFERDGVWRTYSFDRRHLPRPLQQVLRLAGTDPARLLPTAPN